MIRKSGQVVSRHLCLFLLVEFIWCLDFGCNLGNGKVIQSEAVTRRGQTSGPAHSKYHGEDTLKVGAELVHQARQAPTCLLL